MKNIFYLLVVFLVYGCSSNEYEDAAWDVVERSEFNSEELAKFLEHYKICGDNEKYEAACFIVAYMPGKFSLIRENKIYDVDIVKSDSLISSLEQSFSIRKSTPFLKQYSFRQFIEYILPYRIFNEPLEYYWKQDCVNHFHSDENTDVVKAAKDINSQVRISLSADNYGGNLQSYSEVMSGRYGKCDDRTCLLVMALRANGIPAAYEFVPCWGSSNNGHSFVSIILPNDSIYPLQNTDEITSDSYLNRKTPKVYRKTYSSVFGPDCKGFVPDLFLGGDILDVTHLHQIGKRDVETDIMLRGNKYNYLSVFSPSGWVPVSQSSSEIFEHIGTGVMNMSDETSKEAVGLGDGILYLPVSYMDVGAITPIANPIVVSNSEIREIVPDTTVLEKVALTRKYPLSTRIINFARTMRYGVFEAANRIDFSDAVEIYKITELPESRLQQVCMDLDRSYRYFRYRRPKGTFSIAEFKLLDSDGNQLQGIPITCEALEEDEDVGKVFDNDPLTYYEMKADLDLWVGIDLKHPVRAGLIGFAPRNDDNAISPGDLYELFYWNNGWISLGIKKASNFILEFDNVPSNSLLWLRNRTRGREERPFTYENGVQIWW